MIKTLNKCDMSNVNGGMCVNQALSITSAAVSALGVLGSGICVSLLPCLKVTHSDPAQFLVAKAKVAFVTAAIGATINFINIVVNTVAAAYPKCDV